MPIKNIVKKLLITNTKAARKIINAIMVNMIISIKYNVVTPLNLFYHIKRCEYTPLRVIIWIYISVLLIIDLGLLLCYFNES